MARLVNFTAELNSTTDNLELTTHSGTVSITATSPITGTYSYRANPSSSTGFFRHQVYGADQNKGGYLKMDINIATLPGTTIQILRFSSTANAHLASIRLTSSGTLQLHNAANTQVGSASAALSTGVKYTIELKCDSTNATGTLDARLNGASFASGNNSSRGSWARILWGPITPNSTCDMKMDNIILNDDLTGGTETSWPGNQQVITLRPNGAGESNQWKNTAGGAGSSTNYQLVDEVTPNDATDYVQSNTSNNTDWYDFDNSGLNAADEIICTTHHLQLANDTADATTAVKVQVEKTNGGTVTQGAAIIPNSTSWQTDDLPNTFKPTLVTYADPDAAAWTPTTIDSMRGGVKITAAGTNSILVSALYVNVSYVPATLQTITGKARITAQVDQTITGKARIQVTTDRTQTGVSRVQVTTDRTITGKGNITSADTETLQTITGKARITAQVDQTITGKARVEVTTDRTQTGKGNISNNVSQTQTGISRIQVTTDRTITGVARITASVDQTITGKGRVTATTDQTITGKGDISNTNSQTQTGVARIQTTVDQTTTGKARITATTDRTQTGVARVTAQTDRTITGLSRIVTQTDQTQTGKGNISNNTSQTITGVARITNNALGSNIVTNGFFTAIPSFTAATNTNNRWIDGTAGGAASNAGGYGYYFSKSGTCTGELRASGGFHDGGYLLGKITATGSYFEIRNNATGYFQASGFALIPGKSYRASVRMKSENVSGSAGGGQHVQLLCANAAGGSASQEMSVTGGITINKDWTYYQVDFIAGVNSYWAHLEARCYGHNGAGTLIGDFYFAEMQVLPLDQHIQGKARVEKTVDQTITGKARITAQVDQTITGKSRIQVTTDRTQTGISRITAQTDQTITGVARVTATTDRTQTGKGNISNNTSQTQTGISRIQQTVDQTQTGKGRITATTDQTITGKGRVTTQVDQTITGKARIQTQVDQTITGISRIQKTVDQTITGKARITAQTDQTITGKGRVEQTVTQTQTGKARIQTQTDQTMTGKGNISANTSQTQTGKARVEVTTDRTITGKANVVNEAFQTITGKARLNTTTLQTITGKARVLYLTIVSIGTTVLDENEVTIQLDQKPNQTIVIQDETEKVNLGQTEKEKIILSSIDTAATVL